MKKVKLWHAFAALYTILSLVDVTFLAIGNNDVHYYVKPFLMPVLALTTIFLYRYKSYPKLILCFLIGALICHTAGDVFLLGKTMSSFVNGILAFFVGHILYFSVIKSHLKHNTMEQMPVKFLRTLLYLILSLGIPTIIVKAASIPYPMNVYVWIYAMMLINVAFLSGRIALLGVKGGKILFSGSLLFIFSDLLVASQHFEIVKFPFIGAVIMLTYTMSEAFIIWGISSFYVESSAPGCRVLKGL